MTGTAVVEKLNKETRYKTWCLKCKVESLRRYKIQISRYKQISSFNDQCLKHSVWKGCEVVE